MKTEATIKHLEGAKANTNDPNIKKEIASKIDALKNQKTVEKNDNL